MMKKSISCLLVVLATAGCAATLPKGPLRDGTTTVALGEHARFAGLDVLPVRIEEDSRCPTGVQCIQAGTVRLLVRIEDRTGTNAPTFTLGKPIALRGGGWLALAAVCPYPSHPEKIARDSYRLTFAFRVQPPPSRLELPCAA